MAEDDSPELGRNQINIIEREKLINYLNQQQQNRVILNVGGMRFETTTETLRRDSESMFSYITALPNGSTYFIDRDGIHFRIILNYLRGSCTINPTILPRERRYLIELLLECQYYRRQGLAQIVEERLRQSSDIGLEF